MSSERELLVKALGGRRGLIDNALPSILFLVAFNLKHNLTYAIYAAIILSVILTILRLVKKDTLQHALSGLVGVLICAWFARQGGKPENYFIPSFYKNTIYAIAYTFGNLSGWPLLGLVIGPILGENFEWRKVPERKRVYILAGWVWVGMFLIRILIMFPLWKAHQVNALGVASIILGVPLLLLTYWCTWLIIRTVPSVKPDQV